MQLTKNFTLSEMLRSSTAIKMGYKEQFNPSPEIIKNLTELCVHILQPLRDIMQVPVFVSSGYRCERLNKAIGGANRSQHLFGQAADLQAVGKMENSTLFERIKRAELPFDQLIWEFGDDENPNWVHVSYSERNRRQIIYIKK